MLFYKIIEKYHYGTYSREPYRSKNENHDIMVLSFDTNNEKSPP